jgi:hypothetical protein
VGLLIHVSSVVGSTCRGEEFLLSDIANPTKAVLHYVFRRKLAVPKL